MLQVEPYQCVNPLRRYRGMCIFGGPPRDILPQTVCTRVLNAERVLRKAESQREKMTERVRVSALPLKESARSRTETRWVEAPRAIARRQTSPAVGCMLTNAAGADA